jgi:hypothetical protein
MGWMIEAEADGSFSVLKDGRHVSYDEADLESAEEVVRRGGGGSAVLIETDGESTTLRLKPRGRS